MPAGSMLSLLVLIVLLNILGPHQCHIEATFAWKTAIPPKKRGPSCRHICMYACYVYFSSTQLDLLPTGRVSSLTPRCVVLTQLIASVGSFKRLITFFVDRYTLKSMNTSNVMFVCCILLACLCYTYKYAAPLIVKEIYCVHILYN